MLNVLIFRIKMFKIEKDNWEEICRKKEENKLRSPGKCENA